MDKKRRNKMIASYAADWVLTIFLWVSCGASWKGVELKRLECRQSFTCLTRSMGIEGCSLSRIHRLPIRMRYMNGYP
jgi:hypothetical protein